VQVDVLYIVRVGQGENNHQETNADVAIDYFNKKQPEKVV